MDRFSFVAIGHGELEHLLLTRAIVETVLELVRHHGYEGLVVGSRKKGDFTFSYYGCDANVAGWLVLREPCPIPYWRIAEEVAKWLDQPIVVVTLEVDGSGGTSLAEIRVTPDGRQEAVSEETFDDEPAMSAEEAEERLVNALELPDDELTRDTWRYVRRAKRRR